ncbi:MAG: hypothetical protein ABJA93_02120 [Sporichthyaceae bacterium]
MRVTNNNGSTDLLTVQVLRLPMAVSARSTQHFEELMREFALITLDSERDREATDSVRPVPERLLDLVAELTNEFAAFTTSVQAQREEAAARGDFEIDLTYHMPPSATDAVRQLETLLEEVDDFCRSGHHLITLATPPESLAFRRWYFTELLAQMEQGRPPVSWPDYVAKHHQDDDWAQADSDRS